jgi:hypothetical protein
MRTLLSGLMVCLAMSCATPGNYTRSAFGTEGGYSLKNAKPRPMSLMVAQKVERPLYLVVDATKVKDTWPLETSGCAVSASACEHFNLLDMQQFVRRDLKAALENYFVRVEVVDSAAALPATPHFVADVKIDDVRLNALVRGALTYQLIEMTWAFAMRGNEQAEYAYSFAGTAQSNDSYPTFEAGCGTLVENAIPAMLKRWTESGGVEAFRKLGGGAPARSSTQL